MSRYKMYRTLHEAMEAARLEKRDQAIDRLLGAVGGQPHPGRVLSIEAIRDAYRALRDRGDKATKVTTAEALHVHPDTIDRTLRDAGTTFRDLKRTILQSKATMCSARCSRAEKYDRSLVHAGAVNPGRPTGAVPQAAMSHRDR